MQAYKRNDHGACLTAIATFCADKSMRTRARRGPTPTRFRRERELWDRHGNFGQGAPHHQHQPLRVPSIPLGLLILSDVDRTQGAQASCHPCV